MSQKIADKMLQGWAMLANNCPMEGCYNPLVRDLEQKVWCLSCDMEVVTETEAAKRQLSASPSIFESAFEQILNSNPNDLVRDLEESDWKPPTKEEMRGIEVMMERRDKVSQEIGEKMLAGWTLLGDHCGNVSCVEIGIPLMRNLEGNVLCIQCHGKEDVRVSLIEERQECDLKEKIRESVVYLNSIKVKQSSIVHIKETAEAISALCNAAESLNRLR